MRSMVYDREGKCIWCVLKEQFGCHAPALVGSVWGYCGLILAVPHVLHQDVPELATTPSLYPLQAWCRCWMNWSGLWCVGWHRAGQLELTGARVEWLTWEQQPRTSHCSQWTEFLQIHFWVTQVPKSFQNARVKHCRVTAWPSCCLLRKQGCFGFFFQNTLPNHSLEYSNNMGHISQIIRVLEVIKSHTSLQLELERRELMSQRSWLLVPGRGWPVELCVGFQHIPCGLGGEPRQGWRA